MSVRIFVEGTADKRFILQYITHLGIAAPDIVVLNGGNLTHFQNKTFEFERAVADGVQPILIIDADGNNSGRINEVKTFVSKYDVFEDQIFLFPDDEANGELEDLLLRLIPGPNRKILNCLDDASKCIENIGFNGMNKKDRVFQYVSSQLTKGQHKQRSKHAGEQNRDYLDDGVWNLESSHLSPLKAFLKLHL